MITVTLEELFLGFLLCGLIFVFALWLYYDRRDRYHLAGQRPAVVFHCVRCGHLYAARTRRKTIRCPQCDFENSQLRF